MTAVFDDVAAVAGVTAVDSPYDGRRVAGRSSRDGTVAYASVQFDKQDDKVRPATTSDEIRGWRRQHAGGRGFATALGGEMFADERRARIC